MDFHQTSDRLILISVHASPQELFPPSVLPSPGPNLDTVPDCIEVVALVDTEAALEAGLEVGIVAPHSQLDFDTMVVEERFQIVPEVDNHQLDPASELADYPEVLHRSLAVVELECSPRGHGPVGTAIIA